MSVSPYEGGEIPAATERSLVKLFPDAIFSALNTPYERPEHVNLDLAGFGVVEIINPDGTVQEASYEKRRTPQTYIVGVLYDYEEKGILPIGTQYAALQEIMNGTFDKHWSRFYPDLLSLD